MLVHGIQILRRENLVGRSSRKLLILGRLVGFETTARPGLCVTYRKHIAANASVAVFAIAHCPGLPWIPEH
jgi:hypothetical protein